MYSIDWILDRSSHRPCQSQANDFKEDTSDDLSQVHSIASTKTTTTALFHQDSSNKYVEEIHGICSDEKKLIYSSSFLIEE